MNQPVDNLILANSVIATPLSQFHVLLPKDRFHRLAADFVECDPRLAAHEF